ncbi:UNVERIFIED_CONTAM: hypothetical protein FKN15_037615 [Acipenser sinensis]
MNDYRGKPKTYGGDFILARIHSPELKAGAAGVSEDFNNGTYRVNFTLFWPGSVKVSVRLIHSSEVVSAFWRTKESGSDKIMFTGIFLNETKQEKSRCDVHLITNETVCDLKKDSFYCVKPKTLPCETLYYTTSRNTEAYCLTDAENRLMKSKDNNVVVLGWKDKRLVLMLSTFHGSDCEKVQRTIKRGEIQELDKPSVICDYTSKMGAVDRADHYCASYAFTRKSLKWWRKMCFWLLEGAIVNTAILFNLMKVESGQLPIHHKTFRKDLLVGNVCNPGSRKRGRPTSTDREERPNEKPHFIEKMKERAPKTVQ